MNKHPEFGGEVPPGTGVSWTRRMTGVVRGRRSEMDALPSEGIPKRERRPNFQGNKANRDAHSGELPKQGSRQWPWQQARRIATGERVGGVHGAPEVNVTVENVRAGESVWAVVKINEYTDAVRDFNRTLIELRPLGLQAGGASRRAARSREQAQARLRARPALLLDAKAEAEADSFVGRDAELAILRQWHDSPAPFSVMVVHGGGGQGKTRLTRHFAGLAGAGQDPPQLWDAVCLTGTLIDSASAEHPPTAAGGQGRAASAPAHLVIADEADVWPRSKLVELLRSLNRPGERMRVLATARTSGWWWSSLRAEPGLPEITWHDPLHLRSFDAAAGRQLAAAAGRSFAKKLGWPEPSPLPQQDLDQLAQAGSPAASYALLVLARLYAANKGLSAPQSRRAAAELLLEQELRYWALMYGSDSPEDSYRIHLAPPFMVRAVYLATLAGTLGYDIAQPVTQLAGIGCYLTPQQVIEDHARCYPADDSQMLAPLAVGLAEEFLAMLLGSPDHPAGIVPADPWAAVAPFRLLGVMSPQERQPEVNRLKHCITEGEEPPPAEPRYSKATFGPQLQPMITRLARAATSWPEVAEQQLYPLAYFYPRAVVMAGPAAVDELLALAPPRYVREAIDKARTECDPDDIHPYRQAMEELVEMRRRGDPP
jgi:hypothetical protein